MLLLFLIVIWTQGVFGSGCSVQPTNKVVVVGNEVSFTCQTDGESTINSLSLGSDGSKKSVIYQSAIYKSDGTIRATEYIANGYSVIKLNASQITAQIKKTSFSQWGVYHCDCVNPTSKATAKVAVLASEPEFVQKVDAFDGKSVSFTCSISFNGSADASFDISIKNFSGSVHKRQSNLSLSLNQNRYLLTYSFTADINSDQIFVCSVKLIDHSSSANVLYSREKNATVQWRKMTEIVRSGSTNGYDQSASSTGLAVTCAILALSLVLMVIFSIVIYRKLRILQKAISDQENEKKQPILMNQLDKTFGPTYASVRKEETKTPSSDNKSFYEQVDVNLSILYSQENE